MTMNTAWSSTNRIATNFLLKVGLFGLNNAPGQNIRIVTNTDSIIGWGTLKLKNPSGGAALSFNVLMNRTATFAVDSFYLGGAPAPSALLGAFGLTQGQRDTSIGYTFTGTGFKASQLYIDLNNSETRINNLFRAVLPSLGLNTKLSSLADMEVAASVFPNPTTEGVTFEFDKKSEGTWRVFVYNEAGQIFRNDNVNAPIGKVQHTVKFENGSPNGVYFYQIIDEDALIRKTGKVVLSK